MQTIQVSNSHHKFDFNGQSITFLSGDDVMVNATQMAKTFGKKTIEWLRLPSTISFLETLSNVRKSHLCENQMVITKAGSPENGGGTWMHEDVALEFARWLSPQFAIWCNDHIKTLLKHGFTATDNKIEDFLSNPDLAIQAFQALKQERERNRMLESQIEVSAPKVEYYDTVLSSEGLLTTTQIAKNYGWSARKLNTLLHNLGVQFKQSGQWQLYTRYHNCGYTKSVPYPYSKTDGTIATLQEMKWTQQGKEFIHNLLVINKIV